MGRQISFSDENVKKNPFDFPKVKLAKGETARLTVVENPYTEYVHTIQKPILDESGNVVYQTKEKKDGTEYQVPKLTFVSNPICLGDPDVLDAEGIDPENCPVCARAAEGERGFQPKRRFAMHVIRTNTKPGGFEPNGTGYQLLIWAFTDQNYNKLNELRKDFPLKDHDLKLGPCEDAVFQKADLNAAGNTAVDDDTRAKIFNDKTKAEDPTVFCGTRKSKARIEEDLAQVDAVWAKANKEEDNGPSVTSAAALSEGLGNLLKDDEDTANGVPTTSAEPITDLDGLTGGSEKPAAAKSSSEATSLDDILNDL